jgi:hypothetical protein
MLFFIFVSFLYDSLNNEKKINDIVKITNV